MTKPWVRCSPSNLPAPAYPVVSANRKPSRRGLSLGAAYGALLKQPDKEMPASRGRFRVGIDGQVGQQLVEEGLARKPKPQPVSSEHTAESVASWSLPFDQPFAGLSS
jgi:hypothetical protein